MVDTMDDERRKFVKHYFGHEWPDRQLFHAMLNTGVGDDITVETILNLLNAVNRTEEVRKLMKAATAIALASSALLAGCAVGPNYQAPKASVPAQWASSLAGGETNSPADLAAWWRGFGDTNLDSLMVTAVSPISPFALPKPMCAKPALNGMWSPAACGLRSGVRHPIPGIASAKNSFPPLPPGTAAGLQSLQSRLRRRVGARRFWRHAASGGGRQG